MLRKMALGTVCLVLLTLLLAVQGFPEEDKIVQAAIETVKTQMRLPQGAEVKFIEKKESPIQGFYSVKVLVLTTDKEIPVVTYVDEAGTKVILGFLYIQGENVTRKEAGEPKARKIDMAFLEMEKSPFRGPAQAKVTIVEFSHFQCPYCAKSWRKMKELLEKYPQDIKYVFKHSPLESQGKTFDLSEMVAATQAVSHEAFWAVHDFLFSDEGQDFVSKDKDVLKHKIEEILKGRGLDVKAFQTALAAGKGKSRVAEDAGIGNKIGVGVTPSAVINGDFLRGLLPDQTIEKYLRK